MRVLFSVPLALFAPLCCASAAHAQVNINIGQPAYAPQVVVVEHAPKPYHPKKPKKGRAVYLVPTGPGYYYEERGKGKGHGKGKH